MKKISFTIVFITCVYWTFQSCSEYRIDKQLKGFTGFTRVTIEDLSCGKKDFISFRLNGQLIEKRIHLSREECQKLEQEGSIRLKIHKSGHFIFYNDQFNDNALYELIASVIITLFVIVLIYRELRG